MNRKRFRFALFDNGDRLLRRRRRRNRPFGKFRDGRHGARDRPFNWRLHDSSWMRLFSAGWFNRRLRSHRHLPLQLQQVTPQPIVQLHGEFSQLEEFYAQVVLPPEKVGDGGG